MRSVTSRVLRPPPPPQFLLQISWLRLFGPRSFSRFYFIGLQVPGLLFTPHFLMLDTPSFHAFRATQDAVPTSRRLRTRDVPGWMAEGVGPRGGVGDWPGMAVGGLLCKRPRALLCSARARLS